MFTATNWDIEQQVSVNAVADSIDDGDQQFMLRSSIGGWGTGCEKSINISTGASELYSPIDQALSTNQQLDDGGVVSVHVVDSDKAGLVLSKTMIEMREDDVTSQYVSVHLNSQPTQPVVVNIKSTRGDEGEIENDALTFDASNWNATQRFGVRPQRDRMVDGDQIFSVLLTVTPADPSAVDANYDGLHTHIPVRSRVHSV